MPILLMRFRFVVFTLILIRVGFTFIYLHRTFIVWDMIIAELFVLFVRCHC